ncbi:MAG: response regulator [Bacteroidaceae bacterium]|nr:response regulator [Bacteroidaceae bacterium]
MKADGNLAVYDISCIKNIPWGNVYVFFRDSEGYMWYSTEGGLYRDNGYQADVFCSNEDTPRLMRSNYVLDIVEDGKGHIWFGTSQGGYVLDKRDYSIHGIALENTLGRHAIEALYALSDGTVWVSTGTTLFHFDADEHLLKKIDLTKRSCGQKFVTSFLEDSQHGLWLTQSEGGIWHYDIHKGDFVPYVWHKDFNPQCMVEDVAHGCYWIGTWGKGIVKYIPDMVGCNAFCEVQQATLDTGVQGAEKVLDVELDKEAGILWVSTVAGLFAYQFDETNNLLVCPITQQLPKGRYYYRNITRDVYGNLWVSGASRQVFMLPRCENSIRKYFVHYTASTDTDSLLEVLRGKIPDVIRAVRDHDGNIFYQGRQRGLCMLRQGEKTGIPLLHDYETCSSLTILDDGTLWIGTSMGRVYSYDYRKDKAPLYVRQLSDTSGKRILDVQQDRKGHVWVLTQESVKEWDSQSGLCRMLMCNHPMIQMDHFSLFSATTGDSVCVSEEESYCAIASANFQTLTKIDEKPKVSTIIVDGKKHFVCLGKNEMEIDCMSNVVELQLTTLQHHLASQIQFAYRLVKKDIVGNHVADWIELPVGANTIVLTSLDKGNYVVEVRATNGQGIWGEPTVVFTLHRLPAWWEAWWAYMFYCLCLFVLILLIFKMYSRSVRRKRMEQMEEQLTEMKFRFFTNVSHELRTPLTLILVPVEQMLASGNSLPELDRLRLETIHRNTLELQHLVNQLLDFRRMEVEEQRLSLRNGDMNGFVLAAVNAFLPLAQRKGILLNYERPDKPVYAIFDHEKMHHVVWNLLGNAMKFTHERGHINVVLKLNDEDCDLLTVHIIDDGMGIAVKDLPHIFDCYFQSSNATSQGGSGIGLYMVRELIRLHGGEVGVESHQGVGSDFWFVIPLNCSASIASSTTHEVVSVLTKDTSGSSADIGTVQFKNCILLVEDNMELRALIAEQLREEGYAIEEASNGEEAWQRLSTGNNIDLIISDVMMPVMDGFDLCRHVKSAEHTSNTPIILLTAKHSDETRLEGYKMGADYYLTKPFSPAVLLNRIQYLQSQRAVAKQQFQHEESHEIAKLTYSPVDEELIKRAQKIVEEHLSDKHYNVDLFSSDMCASRMTLYRKIHGITGQSPSEFITTIRLKHAANLLRTTTLSASHVAEQTGFSSPSYFTKSFKKMFGVLPKDYRTLKK